MLVCEKTQNSLDVVWLHNEELSLVRAYEKCFNNFSALRAYKVFSFLLHKLHEVHEYFRTALIIQVETFIDDFDSHQLKSFFQHKVERTFPYLLVSNIELDFKTKWIY